MALIKCIVLLVTVALVMALIFAIAGRPASAVSENASERACLGAFISERRGQLGDDLPELTRVEHPWGQNVVSPFATTCVFVGPPPE